MEVNGADDFHQQSNSFLTGVLESFLAVPTCTWPVHIQVGVPNRRSKGVEGPIPAEVDTGCVCVQGCLLVVTQLVILAPPSGTPAIVQKWICADF